MKDLATTFRRGAGSALLALTAAISLASATGNAQVTEDKLNPLAQGPRVVHVSRPAGPTEVGPLLFVGLLLWLPDFASLELVGLIKVRRHLDEVAERQDQVDARMSKVEAATYAQQQMTVNNILGDPERFAAGMHEKADLMTGRTLQDAEAPVRERWERLQLDAARFERSGPNAASAVTRWRTVFANELAVVKTAIESPARDQKLPPVNTAKALEILEQYLIDAVDGADGNQGRGGG